MGDVVLSTAVAEAWMAENSGPVDVLVKQEWEGVWQNHPGVRHVYGWKRADRTWEGWRRLGSVLRNQGYCFAADLQGSPRTRSLLAWAEIPSARPQRFSLRRRALVRLKLGGPPPGFRVVRTFLDAAQTDPTALPKVHPSLENQAAASKFVSGCDVGLAPWARHSTKQWPIDRFAAVGRLLARQGCPVPVFMDPGEAAQLEAMKRVWPQTDQWIPVQESIPMAAAVLSRLRGLVTGDTGLMHLAAAVGTSVVAIFGPTVGEFGFLPSGPGHQVLQIGSLDCRPCSVHGSMQCPKAHFKCMLDVTEDNVIAAVDNIPVNAV